jgi:hypothetical protein
MPRPRALALALMLAACELKVANGTDESATTGDSASTSPTTGEPWPLDGCMTRFFWDCWPQFDCDPPQPLPHPNCGGPMLCDPIQIRASISGAAVYDHVIPEAAVPCVLQALRDRTPGTLSIEWGIFHQYGAIVSANVWLLGDETVRMSWKVYDQCCGRNIWYISRRVPLQPPAFFDDCLAADLDGQLACFTAGLDIYDPAPDGWLPPWTLGKCDDALPATCE